MSKQNHAHPKPSLLIMLTWLASFFGFTTDSLDAQAIDLAQNPWRIAMGDEQAWAAPDFDDSAWKTTKVGEPWELALGSIDGTGWYRSSVFLDKKTLKKAVSRKKGMMLYLGKIDDADETFFNGVKIGGMGLFPPANETAWDQDRIYFVPQKLLRWDAPNTIAVRVSDTGGGGGLYAGEYRLEPMTWKNQFSIQVDNLSNDNTFAKNQTIGLLLRLNNVSNEKLTGKVTTRVDTYAGEQVATQTVAVQVNRKENLALAPVRFDALPIGFYQVKVDFEDESGKKVSEKHAFAVSPNDVAADLKAPVDFGVYWQKARAELDSIAPDFQLTLLPQYSTALTDVFEVTMRSLGQARVRGYYARPKSGSGMPGLLHVQGYSSYMTPFDVDQPWAQFFLNIRGHGNSRDDVNPGFPGYLLSGLEDPEHYIYRGAYMDCVRAVDFLCSRPEVDAQRIAVEGGSQGGALSIATAALDKRIKLCAPDVPFLSNFRLYFQIAHWPTDEFMGFAGKTHQMLDNFYPVLDYIDISNLAPSVTCPVLMAVGLYDDVCPPAINFSAYNRLASTQKSFRLYPKSGHAIPGEHYEIKRKWLREHGF